MADAYAEGASTAGHALRSDCGGMTPLLCNAVDTDQGPLEALSLNKRGIVIDSIPQTPVGPLDAIEKRLEAMIQAAKTVQPALEELYASLTDEQKSRFNTLGQQAVR